MAKFQYKALKNKTEFVEGEIEATSYREARQKIIELGFLPTKVYSETLKPEKYSEHISAPVNEGKTVRRLSMNEKTMFTSELQTLLSSGISIVEALESVERNTASKKIKTICNTLKQSILAGNTFAQSMEKYYSKVFGQIYIGLVKAGETAGELEETLLRMLVILNKQAKILDKIKSASIYPAILIVMLLGLVTLFSVLVFPKLMGVVNFSGGEIPLFAQTVFGFCTFVQHFWWLLIVLIVGLISGFKTLMQTYLFKRKVDNFVLHVPKLSDFVKYTNLANYMTVLAISYESGVPIASALELSNKTIDNIVIKTKLSRVASMVRNGKSLVESLDTAQVIPPTLMSMIATGEKTGSLGKMLQDSADVIDKKVDFVLEALSKAFEPAIIIILGICVGSMLFAFMQVYASALSSMF